MLHACEIGYEICCEISGRAAGRGGPLGEGTGYLGAGGARRGCLGLGGRARACMHAWGRHCLHGPSRRRPFTPINSCFEAQGPLQRRWHVQGRARGASNFAPLATPNGLDARSETTHARPVHSGQGKEMVA